MPRVQKEAADPSPVPRYGLAAAEAIICGFMDVLSETKPEKAVPLDPKQQKMVLDALNGADLPGEDYTWEGVRKASTTFFFWFLLFCCFALAALPFYPLQHASCSSELVTTITLAHLRPSPKQQYYQHYQQHGAYDQDRTW